MKICFSCFKEYKNDYKVCPHCGQIEITEPNEPIHLFPGTVLADRYIIGTSVGSGGFGIVYKAWDTKLNTVVAVKEFFVSRLVTRAKGLRELIVTKKSQTEYNYRKERFLAEARNMAKFGSHKNIPNVFEFFEENNTAYIVMELLHGVALNEYIANHGGKIDIDFALMIANEVGNALKSLHNNNIIHRDVAPDNIYICSDKEIRIKLMDLGAAKLADATDDVIDIILKPGYSPTEQYDNSKSIGPWTDIYALSATLYMMLTGIKPDESTNRKINDILIPPDQLNSEITENLSNAIMKAMAVEKHMRFKSVKEFLLAINGEKKVLTITKERKRKRLKRFYSVLVSSIALILVACTAMLFYNEKKSEQNLRTAEISVWFSAAEGSNEAEAMESITNDFMDKFPNVTINLCAIPENEYISRLEIAANEGSMPTLFESTGANEKILSKAADISAILSTTQAEDCYFIDQYCNYYEHRKQIPLAIEVPIAYVITNGATYIDYDNLYFSVLDDFGSSTNISYDDRYVELLNGNFKISNFSNKKEFLNNYENTSPVLLSSSMIINEVRQTLVNYEKLFVFYDSDKINCLFTYEWSLGSGTKNEMRAAERLLTWMLGNVYQNTLMISESNDGQIPINSTCFKSKIQSSKNLEPLEEIYEKFVFERGVSTYE